MSAGLSLQPNEIFASDYRVIRLMARGGMGAVYEAEQISTGARRALKLMLPEVVRSEKQRLRFAQEARVSGKIESDHVVQVVGAGVADNGTPWLAMELLKGESLEEHLRRLGPRPPREIDQIYAQLCHALGLAHDQGIVHRDLKPENIFISPSRVQGTDFFVKILDFGVARLTAAAKSTLTEAAGTPLWMAPEQTARGASILPATDVWALGLIAFWMLTGKLYWLSAHDPNANAFTVLTEVISGPLTGAAERAAEVGFEGRLPPDFDAWFGRCVSREIGDRFPDARTARNALPAALGLERPEPIPATIKDRVAERSGTVPLDPVLGPGLETADEVTDTGELHPELVALGHDPEAATVMVPQGSPGPPAAAGAVLRQSGETVAGPARRSGETVMATPGQLPPAALPQALISGGAVAASTGPSSLAAVTNIPGGGVLPYTPKARRKGGKGVLIALALLLGLIAVIGLIGGGVYIWYTKTQQSAETKCLADGGDKNLAQRIEACRRSCAEGKAKHCARLGELLQRQLARDPAVADELADSWSAACDDGDKKACSKLGALYLQGVAGEVERDAAKARKLLTKACDGDEPAACARLGGLLDLGQGSERDVTKVVKLFDQACRRGDGLGCGYLGALLSSGRGIARDEERAEAAFARAKKPLSEACDGGGAAECAVLGFLHQHGHTTEQSSAEAIRRYQQACDGGDATGCSNLGAIHLSGEGVLPNAQRALELFERACAQGEAAGCNNAGAMRAVRKGVFRYGARASLVLKLACEGVIHTGCTGFGKTLTISEGIAPEHPKAVELFQRACDAGEPNGCVNLGAMARFGLGTEYDRRRAVELFKLACDSGNASGCGELGASYAYATDELRDFRKGYELMQRACGWGELDACVSAAGMVREGRGVLKDPAAAAEVFQRHCDGGVQYACAALADLLLAGEGLAQDVGRAFELLQAACRAGYDNGCTQLAGMYLKGTGVPKDLDKGIALLRRGCDAGSRTDCNTLAEQHLKGEGVAKDQNQAIALLDESCKAGHLGGCGYLGWVFAVGHEGVPRDDARALGYLKKACDLGDEGACGNLGEFYNEGKAGLAQDKAEARRWLTIACEGSAKWACETLKKL